VSLRARRTLPVRQRRARSAAPYQRNPIRVYPCSSVVDEFLYFVRSSFSLSRAAPPASLSVMRILIATETAGGGHLAAAAALEEAWRALRPGDVVERVDLVKFFSPLHRKIHADGYVKLVARAPELWGMLFAKTDDPKVARRLNRIKALFPSRARSRFAKCVREFNPDVVLCTHYEPVEAMGELRRNTKGWIFEPTPGPSKEGSAAGRARKTVPLLGGARGGFPFLVSIVTDFEAHALWMDPDVDLYCVAAEETKARLIARGATDDKAVATGIPIGAKFAAKVETLAVRRTLGLRDDLPTLLVLSGGFGMGPVGKILAALDKAAPEFQTVVVCGRNEELRRELAAQDRKHPTRVLGFASNMHELMTVADLLLTKPGGLTSSEALALGKPLFILDPIPGQEAANSDFLLERGAATKVNRVEDLPFRIEQLLGTKKLGEMAKAAKTLGRLKSAEAVCAEVLRRVKS
jgi:processive 1,2-diacylglycerol beta-glucosyltransferase